ncbi:MAG: AGE family epimerase/isomerase [Anaerolineae bacterium]|nr:AGE family epimerase/isomerase [Anaerolineae bacterium]
MDRQAQFTAWIERAETELCGNVLPFWLDHAVDRERGGFYGTISNDLVIDRDAPRGALLSSRILWTFSAAYRRYRRSEYLAMARHACDDLLAHFWDNEHGGLFWEIDAEGNVTKGRKQIYGQAFGIYALAEFFAASGEQAALDRAIDLFHLVEQYSYDPLYGGYLEACTRDWQLEEDMRLSDMDRNEKKSMNTHLHVMEAYTNLRRVWGRDKVARDEIARDLIAHRHREMIDVMMTRIIDRETAHTILFFDQDWPPKSDEISYGHDIEASWLLVEAAEVDGDEALIREAKDLALRMAQAVYEQALDADGGLMYEAGPHGWVDDSKEWWPQAEAVVGFLNAYQLSAQAHFLDAALASWAFIERYLIDRQHGEWFRGVHRDGTLKKDEFKVSFWKCPYHNGRACMEIAERLRTLL